MSPGETMKRQVIQGGGGWHRLPLDQHLPNTVDRTTAATLSLALSNAAVSASLQMAAHASLGRPANVRPTRVWPGSLTGRPGCHSEGKTAFAASRAAGTVEGGRDWRDQLLEMMSQQQAATKRCGQRW
jgi:hypothetical protein